MGPSDLADLMIVSDKGSRPSKTRCSALVAVARLAGEADSEMPYTCCPIIGSFTRVVSRVAGRTARRTIIASVLPSLVGSWSPPDEEGRARLLANWVLWAALPPAFAAAGYSQLALSFSSGSFDQMTDSAAYTFTPRLASLVEKSRSRALLRGAQVLWSLLERRWVPLALRAGAVLRDSPARHDLVPSAVNIIQRMVSLRAAPPPTLWDRLDDDLLDVLFDPSRGSPN